VSPTFELIHFSLSGQEEVSGFVISDAAGTITLRMEGGIVAEYQRDEILDRRRSSVSAMPDDLQEQMSVDDLVDLVEYLSRLR
jgi:putative heme-binding domain-containing protein